MDSSTVQLIVDRKRPRDGQLVTCKNCGHDFSSYRGRFWCRICREFFECAHVASIHGYMIKSDGVKSGRRWCVACGATTPTRKWEGCGPVLFYDLRDGVTIPACERCESTEGTQLHHWAPRAIFGAIEAERWPTAYLCPACHSVWHAQMRLAAGYRLPPEQRIEDYDTAAAGGHREGVTA